MAEIDEIGITIDALKARMGELVVRGLSAVLPGDLAALDAHAHECERIGMAHLATRLQKMLVAIKADERSAARAFLSAYTSLHVFERVLSLEVAESAWKHALAATSESKEEEGEGESAKPESKAKAAPLPAMPADDIKKLALLLDELSRAVEDLVKTGLTSATQATRQKLDVSFKEASRMKLLRLGASLRYVNEEVGRYLEHSDGFSQKRFVFFAHRSWLLARGVAEAMRTKNDAVLAKLLYSRGPEPLPVKSIEVVTLGVLKRTVQSACTFEFRLRVVGGDDKSLVGRSLLFPLVFGRKNPTIAAEAFLHLPQPQKFNPKVFTEPRALVITQSAVVLDDKGGGRLMLGPKATVTPDKPPASWEALLKWDIQSALSHLQAHETSPLDLAVELQEEVFLQDWQCQETTAKATPERRIFEITTKEGLTFDAVIPSGADGKDLGKALLAMAKKKSKPTLYGQVYYELGRLVFLPLSFIDSEGPTHLMISNEKINLTALLGNLNLQ